MSESVPTPQDASTRTTPTQAKPRIPSTRAQHKALADVLILAGCRTRATRLARLGVPGFWALSEDEATAALEALCAELGIPVPELIDLPPQSRTAATQGAYWAGRKGARRGL